MGAAQNTAAETSPQSKTIALEDNGNEKGDLVRGGLLPVVSSSGNSRPTSQPGHVDGLVAKVEVNNAEPIAENSRKCDTHRNDTVPSVEKVVLSNTVGNRRVVANLQSDGVFSEVSDAETKTVAAEVGDNDSGAAGHTAGDGAGVANDFRSDMEAVELPGENSAARKPILAEKKERPKLSLVRNSEPQQTKGLAPILTSEKTILIRENKRRGRKKKSTGLPDFGDYHYWKTGSKNGFALEYRPPVRNLRGEITEYDYHYIGFWNTADWDRIKGALNEQEIREQVRVIIESKRLISAFRDRVNSGTRSRISESRASA